MTKLRPMQLATLALLVGGLAAPPLYAQGKTFTVGVPLPLTGAEAKFGEMEKQAYEMAAEEINAKGGVKGHKISFDIQDSGGKAETATAYEHWLVYSPTTIGYLFVPMNFSTIAVAVSGLPPESWMSRTSFWPFTPPLALISSTAIS